MTKKLTVFLFLPSGRTGSTVYTEYTAALRSRKWEIFLTTLCMRNFVVLHQEIAVGHTSQLDLTVASPPLTVLGVRRCSKHVDVEVESYQEEAKVSHDAMTTL